jgi:hypothetical protein
MNCFLSAISGRQIGVDRLVSVLIHGVDEVSEAMTQAMMYAYQAPHELVICHEATLILRPMGRRNFLSS